jgi:hypothetical protein
MRGVGIREVFDVVKINYKFYFNTLKIIFRKNNISVDDLSYTELLMILLF